MVLFCIIFLSIVLAIVSIFLIPSAGYFFIPIIVLIASFIGFNVMYLLYLFFLGLFVDMKKTYTEQNKLYNLTTIYSMQWLIGLFNVKVETSGLEKIPHDEKYMLVYNHTSNFDPIIESWVLRQDNLIHTSKPGNFKKPFAGKVVYRNCYIPIDRDNNREAAKSILRACNFISDGKYCIGVSPEGTRNKGSEKELLPFRDGCFKIALRTKCPIVICELENMSSIKHVNPLKKTKVKMNILDVLYYDDYKDQVTHEISERVRNEIQLKLNEN